MSVFCDEKVLSDAFNQVVSLNKIIKNKLIDFEKLMLNELNDIKLQNDRLKGTLGALEHEVSVMTESLMSINKAIDEASCEYDAALKKYNETMAELEAKRKKADIDEYHKDLETLQNLETTAHIYASVFD